MYLNPQRTQSLLANKGNKLNNLFKFFIIGKKRKQLMISNGIEEYELLENIRIAKMEWENANMNFEHADRQEMVDYYSYNIMACQVKYEYFIRKAKEKGLKVESLR